MKGVLLRGGMLELVVLQALFSYNSDTDAIRSPGPLHVPCSSFIPINHGETYKQLVMYRAAFRLSSCL